MGGLLEMLSVSLILPFMDAVMYPEDFMSKWYGELIYRLANIKAPMDYIVFLAVLQSLIYVTKNVYLVLEYYVQYRFVYNNMFHTKKTLQ